MSQTSLQVYFDESGNTGGDLFNQDQRFFVLGTNCFQEKELDCLKSVFAKDGNELHFVQLKESKGGRAKIADFINHELIAKNRIFFAFADKLYLACAKLIDILIEPLFHSRGIDILSNGHHLILTDCLCRLSDEPTTKGKAGRLLRAFVKMCREKSLENFNDFYNIVNKWIVVDKDEEFLVSLISDNRSEIYDCLINNKDKYALDVTTALFCNTCWHLACEFWKKTQCIV